MAQVAKRRKAKTDYRISHEFDVPVRPCNTIRRCTAACNRRLLRSNVRLSSAPLYAHPLSNTLLCRRFKVVFPARKHQDSRMALKRARDDLGAFHSKADTVILDG